MEDAPFSDTIPHFNYDDGNSLCKATGDCLICHSCGWDWKVSESQVAVSKVLEVLEVSEAFQYEKQDGDWSRWMNTGRSVGEAIKKETSLWKGATSSQESLTIVQRNMFWVTQLLDLHMCTL